MASELTRTQSETGYTNVGATKARYVSLENNKGKKVTYLFDKSGRKLFEFGKKSGPIERAWEAVKSFFQCLAESIIQIPAGRFVSTMRETWDRMATSLKGLPGKIVSESHKVALDKYVPINNYADFWYNNAPLK